MYAIFDDGKLITFEGDCEVGKIIHASVVKDQKDLQKKGNSSVDQKRAIDLFKLNLSNFISAIIINLGLCFVTVVKLEIR